MVRLRSVIRRSMPLVMVALVASACAPLTNMFGEEKVVLYADFDDVSDLVPEAHVRAGDVPIGFVEDIQLNDDLEARVKMRIVKDTGLPRETKAVLSKTGLLGERYIDLRPVGTEGSIDELDGQRLEDTGIVSDFEDFVDTGNEVLAFVAADRLGAMVQVGAETFGGRGSLLGGFLEDVNGFVARYQGGEEDILALIDSVDRLTARLAPNAEDNAAAFVALDRFAQALEEEDDRLLDSLEDITRLADVGGRILEENGQQITRFFRRLHIIVGQLTRIDGALQGVLTWGPRHNRHVPNGSVGEHAQVWLDFIICGSEGEVEGDPTRDCTPPHPGESAQQPPYHPNDEACMEDPDNCPLPEEGPAVSPEGGIGELP